MKETVIAFLQAVSATSGWVSGLIFLRFWRTSRDALFAFFAAGFWLLALSWTLLALLNPIEDSRPYVYAIRMMAFLLIIVGMIHKNRSAS